MKIPVSTRKFAVNSFYGREEEAFTLKEKMKSLMEGLETVKGEVVEEKEGLTLLSIPCIQEKLESKELSVPTVSRRQAHSDKLRSKKLIPK